MSDRQPVENREQVPEVNIADVGVNNVNIRFDQNNIERYYARLLPAFMILVNLKQKILHLIWTNLTVDQQTVCINACADYLCNFYRDMNMNNNNNNFENPFGDVEEIKRNIREIFTGAARDEEELLSANARERQQQNQNGRSREADQVD
jgi:hypothetical protein